MNLVVLLPDLGWLLLALLFALRSVRSTVPTWVAIAAAYAGVALAGMEAGLVASRAGAGSALGGLYLVDSWAAGMRVVLMLVAAGALAQLAPTRRGAWQGAAIALGTAGAMALPAAQDLLAAAGGLLVLGIGTSGAIASQAGLEPLRPAMRQAVSAATALVFVLAGATLLFGLAGGTSFRAIAMQLGTLTASGPMEVGALLVLAGLAFGAALAPWLATWIGAAQGVQAPIAAWTMASGSLGAIGLLARWLPGALAPAQTLWAPALVAMAVGALVLTALWALSQGRLRPLLATLATAHAAFFALALLATGRPESAPDALPTLALGLVTLGASLLGALAVLDAFEREHGPAVLADLGVMAARMPGLAMGFGVCALSLVGAPFTIGFVAHWHALQSLVDYAITSQSFDLVWLALLGALGWLAMAYHGVRMVRALVTPPGDPTEPLEVPARVWAVAIAAAVVSVLGFLGPSLAWSTLGALPML